MQQVTDSHDPQPSLPRVVFVVGMHRSATSAVSRLLGGLGLHHGDPSDLLPPAPDNPYGFWEHAGVKSINDRLLRHYGGTWQNPPHLTTGWIHDPDLSELRQEAKTILDELLETSSPEGLTVKDPRLSLTLTFWHDLVPDGRVLLAVRDPAAVAASLLKRNEIPVEQSIALWVRYTTSTLATGLCNAVTIAERLSSEPTEEASRIVRELGLDMTHERIASAVADTIVADALHSEGADIDSATHAPAATTLYRMLRDEGCTDDLVGLSQSLHVGARFVAGHDVVHEQLREARLHAEKQQARVSELQQQVRDLRGEQHEHEKELAAFRDIAHEREKHVEELAAQLFQTQDAVREQEEATAAAHRRAEKAEHDAQQWRERAERHERSLTRLRSRRSVRATLRVAEASRPAFKAWRAYRKTRATRAPHVEGHPTDRAPTEADGPYPARKPPAGPPAADIVRRLESAPRLTIIIPVHGAVDHARRCIESVHHHLPPFADVLVIDDGSPQAGDWAALQEIVQDLTRVSLIRNDRNLGFTRTVNRGLQVASDRDVVIVNSDTVIPPMTFQRLRTAAYAYDDVATVTPLSDNAGAFSAPEVGEANDLGGAEGCAELTIRLMGAGNLHYPTAPTGNGFCLYIRRAALDDVGGFDADAFPRGYGEENDLSMRMEEQGWAHLIEPTVLVHHVRSASFGHEKDQLARAGRAVLDKRHPTFTRKVRSWVPSQAMKQARGDVERAQAASTRARPVVLYLVQDGSGGTPATALDLAREISHDYDALILMSNARDLKLHRVTSDSMELIETTHLESKLMFGQRSRDDYLAYVTSVLVRYGVTMVHVRHLIRHTFDAIRAARAIGIPTALSLHDFYYVCPTINLMDEHGKFCGGVCTEGDGDCPIAMRWISDSSPKLKHSGVHWWRDETRELLQSVDRLVVTSFATRDVYANIFPEITERIEVVEHGRDFDRTSGLASLPYPDGKIRILFPGNMAEHKGSRVIRALKQADTDRRLELHFAGRLREEDEDLADYYHGTYERDRFDEIVSKVRPSYIGLLSTCSETYCHTLSEAWAVGVPVIGSNMGAIRERIERHGGGITVPIDNSEVALTRILEATDAPETYRELRKQAERARIRPVSEMADAFRDLYSRVSGPPPEVEHPSEVELDLFLRGFPPPYPGSVYVRTIARAENPHLNGLLSASSRDAASFLSAGLQHHGSAALVQRDAVEPELVDQFLRLLRFLDMPLVLDLDDNLLDPTLHPDSYWTKERSRALHRLLKAADLITVSTPEMADLVAANTTTAIRLEPNQLRDDWWGLDLEPPSRPDDDPHGEIRVGYQGSLTHGGDLELLRDAMDHVPADVRERIRVEVVGGEPGNQSWYDRIPVPNDAKPYPEFARWMQTTAQRWHFAVAPLREGGLNTWKSDLKFLEYSALGLPTIVTDLAPYRDIPSSLTIKAQPEAASWAEAIAEMATDIELRRTLGRASREWVLRERRMSQHVPSWYSAVRELARE